MKAPKFREFITEAPENGKYKLLVVTDEPEKAKTFHTADRLKDTRQVFMTKRVTVKRMCARVMRRSKKLIIYA